MRINTNVSAMMAANNLSTVQDAVSSSMEKLSSGFRINKAADDAAGLGIANTLRADGLALSQASRNADQTTSLLQVAEGGASTVESILERMKELATQSASDTVDAAGRASIDAEFTALRSEISRTVSTTTFQGSSLLDGTYGTAPGSLAAGDIVSATNGNAPLGSYSLSVSGNVVTLTPPSGPAETVDVSTLGQPDYSNGKIALKFGTGTSQITIDVAADNPNDITSVANTLNGKSFSMVAGTSGTHVGALAVAVPGVTIGTINSSVTDGTYNISATDRASTLVGSQAGVTLNSVGTNVAAGNYTVAVTDASATLGGTGVTSMSGLTVSGGQAADNYTFAVDTSAHSITIKDGLGNTVATQTFIAGSGGTDGDAIAFNNNGFQFNLSGTGDSATWSALQTALQGSTVDVTAAKIDVKQGSTVIASQNLTSGYPTNGTITFADGASDFNFTVDTSNANANTWTKAKSALQNSSFTVTDAHIDVKQGSTTVATESYTPAQAAAGQQLNFSNNGVAFSVSAGLNTGWTTVANALASQPMVVSSTLAGANTAANVLGNTAVRSASFMIDSSGQYKTNDMIQLDAIDLTVGTLGLTNSDLSTADGAQNALSTIDSAMNTVSTALGSIGANQNRISYAQDNLKTKITNYASAESVIRDVDMADEMTTFSKNQILAQAGTAMLAQANQQGASVLKLLQ